MIIEINDSVTARFDTDDEFEWYWLLASYSHRGLPYPRGLISETGIKSKIRQVLLCSLNYTDWQTFLEKEVLPLMESRLSFANANDLYWPTNKRPPNSPYLKTVTRRNGQ